MDLLPNIELVLRGMSGLATLCYLAGMLYFGFTLMRVRQGRPAEVFFWAVVSQALGVALTAVASLVVMYFSYSMTGGGGANWSGVMAFAIEGWVLLSGIVAAVALLMSTTGGARR